MAISEKIGTISTFEPKYHQLEEILREQIASLEPDEMIPSENQLCQMYSISRTTAHKAVDNLVREGLLYRIQGKGTFVAQPKLQERFAQRTAGFYEDMTSRGLSVETKVIEQTTIPATKNLAEKLDIAENGTVIKLVRLRLINGQQILVSTTYLPHYLCPGLEKEDLSDTSLYALLEQKYGIQLARGVRSLEAAPCTDVDADQLGIDDANIPLLVLSGIMYDQQGRVVEYTHAKHRADRSRIEIEVLTGSVIDSEG
jgi:GntR family transcriptional regulator